MPLESLQNGRYHSEGLLGSGSMGEVYLFYDTVIDRRVAIKLMRANPVGYPDTESVKEAVKSFKREAQAIAKLEHPNILPLYDFGEEKRENTVFTYMVTPHCPQGSLDNWLQQHRSKGPLAAEEVAYFVEQAAAALQYAHEHGVIHQDVKPSNFLLRMHAHRQNLPDLLLADFGIAKLNTGTTTSTTHIGARGTPRYMPPEQWENKPVPASDQYALAVMAYQLLTQTPPFQGEQMHQLMYQHNFTLPDPPGKFNPYISPALDAVILRALAKKPTERFSTVQAFATAFRQALQPVKQPHRPPSSEGERLILPGYSQPPSAFTAPNRHNPSSLTPLPPVDTPMFVRPQQLAQYAPPTSVENWQAQPAYPVESRKRASAGKRVIFVGLTFLVVLAGAGLLYYFLQPKSDPNKNPYTSTMPNLRYYDPLSQPDFWLSDPNNKDTNGYCLFQQSAYHVSSNVPSTYNSCPTQHQPVTSDMTFEVQMQILHGNCGGILFRGDFQQGNFYYYSLCSDGRHYLATYANSQQISFIRTQLTPFSTLQANSQATVNVAIVAQGSSLTFYLNKQQIDQINDPTYNSGQLTLLCYEIDKPTEVVFSNARLWTA
jgi:eukaryotic-like serine/threonine-protein kinase